MPRSSLQSHMRDVELARRCSEGDREALEALVGEHYGPVVNFVHRFTGMREDAHDLAQEVFVKALRALPRYDGRAGLRTWLFTIAGNACRDALRRRRRRKEDVVDESGLALLVDRPDADLGGSPDRTALDGIRADALRRAVDQLPEVHRMAVVLRFYHDMSLQEIADVCGCTIGTVGSRLHYALKKLRKLLVDNPDAAEAVGAVEGGLSG